MYITHSHGAYRPFLPFLSTLYNEANSIYKFCYLEMYIGARRTLKGLC